MTTRCHGLQAKRAGFAINGSETTLFGRSAPGLCSCLMYLETWAWQPLTTRQTTLLRHCNGL